MLVVRCLLRTRSSRLQTAVSAVVAHAIDVVHDDGLVVDIRDMDVRDVVHRSVVSEGAVMPVPALVAITRIAVSVIDATVEADMRTPVAMVEDVRSVALAPVAGCP